MKRTVRIVMMAAATLAVFSGLVQAAAKKPESIRIGYVLSASQAKLLVAKELGWIDEEFAKDGIKVNIEKFLSGPPIVEAIAGSRLDFGQVGDQPAIQAKTNNNDIKVVGVTSWTVKGEGLVVPYGSNIKSPRDLKGKKIGVPVGSTSHRLLYLLLKANGLTPKDIKEVNLTPPDIKTALIAKNIDAAALWEPWISTFEIENIAQQTADGTGLTRIVNVIAVSSAFAKEYPEVVQRLLKVYVRAEKWIKQNPKKTEEIVAKLTGFKPEILAKAVPKYDYETTLSHETVKSLALTGKFLKDNKLIRKDIEINELVDTGYLKAIGAL
jgi:sulfonate transport system substrate-binding protein